MPHPGVNRLMPHPGVNRLMPHPVQSIHDAQSEKHQVKWMKNEMQLFTDPFSVENPDQSMSQ